MKDVFTNHYLADTNILLFMGYKPERVSSDVKYILEDTDNKVMFSVASIWEIMIKSQLNKPNFSINVEVFRRHLLKNGFLELSIGGEHAISVGNLPENLHKDPFDRIIVSQAKTESLTLITSDSLIIKSCSNHINIIPNN